MTPRTLALTRTWVGTKLILAFGLLMVVVLTLGLAAIFQTDRVNHSFQHVFRDQFPKVDIAGAALRYSTENNRITMQIFLLDDPRAIQALLAKRAQNTAVITQLHARISRLLVSPEERRLFDAVRVERGPYIASYLKALALLLDEKDRERARRVMIGETLPLLERYHSAMRAFVDFENEQMTQEAKRADQMSAASRTTITVLLVSALLTALLIGAVMAAGILKELNKRHLVQERLRASHEALEARVRDRTAELALVNETLMRQNLEITLFGQMDDLLQSCNTSEEAYRAIPVSMKQLFPEDSGALFTFGGTDRTSRAAAWGGAPPEEREFSLDDCWGLRRGRVHGRADIEAGVRCRHVEAGDTAYLCVPIIAHGAALGVLHVLLASSDSERWEVRQSLAVRVGEHLGMALAKLELQETLQQLSVRDPLTGLFNRRYMEESLDRELRRAEREGKPIGIIMLDIDHFKSFNDTFGHDGGDALLRELGVLLPHQIRSSDIACRYGGEEFAIIMPDAGMEMTRQRAERIREIARKMRVRHGERVLDSVTLSLGVAAFPQNGVTREALMKDADVALYRAKNEGRDRVCMAESQAQTAMPGGRVLSFMPTA